ncbi:MFS transporter [Streptomyces sp. NBC_00286]|uniref:MFS transporter n=1 Tax=Streptomyces sp. NBC_00286 TaxID=2975701 RepID=UPI002E2E78B2|nr:MFS transporter [Streptomyces sp. NBC_00286]
MGRTRLFALFALLTLTGFITTLDNTVINVALPTVQRELGLSVTDLEWVASSYVLSFGALLLPGGRLTDLFGRRSVFTVGVVVFTAASAAAAVADSGGTLIAARTVQGVGAALVIPASLAVVAADLPARRQSMAVGLWTAALAVALALGPVVGGFVTQQWSWGWVFALNVPFGIIALLLMPAVPAKAKDPPGSSESRRGGLDLPGVLFSVLALYLLTYGLVRGTEHGFGAAPVPLCLAVAAVATCVFLLVESRTARPLVELALLRDRFLTGGVLAQVLWGIGVNGVFFFTALYLQQVLGFSPTRAGLAFLPLAGALLLCTPLAERAARVLGAHVSIAAGLAMVATGLLYVSGSGAQADYWDLQPGLLLIGAGSALTTPLTVRCLTQVPHARTGMATGLVSAAREVSGVFGVVLVGVVLTRRERSELRSGADPRTAFLEGYDLGLRLAACCVLAGAFVTLATLRRRGRHRRVRQRWIRPRREPTRTETPLVMK